MQAINKRLGNPVMMKLAGSRYWFAGVIRHKGRRSGREYATPVCAVPAPDGFLVSLPFGEGVDRLRNVQAIGGRLSRSGARPGRSRNPRWWVGRLRGPRCLPRRAPLLFGLGGIERYLKLRRL